MANPTTATFTGQDGALRLYDSTATPFYVALPFVRMNLSAPIGRPRPSENLRVMSREAEYHPGPIDALLEPQPLSFTLWTTHVEWAKVRAALGIDFAAADAAVTTWTVDGDTWVSTYGDTTIYDIDGVAVPRPSALADTRKMCSNVEALWTVPSAGSVGFKWGEVYFEPQNVRLSEAPGEVAVAASGLVYGAISPITSFTAGNES